MKKLFILPLCFIIVVATTIFAQVATAQQTPQSTPSEDDPLIIAIIPFTNLSGQKEYDWFGVGIGEVLTTKLGTIPCFRIIEKIKLSEALQEVKFGQSGLVDEHTAPRIGKMIGAEELLVGSYQIIGKKIRIDARLVEVETSKIHVTTGTAGELDNIFEHQDHIAKSLLKSLNIPLTEEEKAEIMTKPTTSQEAYKLYIQAADIYTPAGRALSDDQRISLLEQSTRVDPSFAQAYSSLGDIYAERKRDYRGAGIYYEKAVHLQPHNPAPRIRLVRVYEKQGKAHAASLEKKRLEEINRRLALENQRLQAERKDTIRKRRLEQRKRQEEQRRVKQKKPQEERERLEAQERMEHERNLEQQRRLDYQRRKEQQRKREEQRRLERKRRWEQ